MHPDKAALEGRTALVTGASSGIGRAIATILHAAGARVVLTARRVDRLERLARELGERASVTSLDVADPASVAGLGGRLADGWGEVDILVNNAGQDVGGRRLFHEGDAETWARIIDTNVTGLVRVTRAFIDGMRERDHGHVVNIGSVAGLKPYATGTLYAASKHAVHGFSEALRLDYRGTGIRVTEILPGMVETGFAAARWGDEDKAREFYAAFGRCLDPGDVARTVLFAVTQPPHVVISQLVVVPASQD